MSQAVDKANEVYRRIIRAEHQERLLEKHLPWYVGRFLGARPPGSPTFRVPRWARSLSILLATFATMTINMAIFKYAAPFKGWVSPEMLPSFGATAILLFNATASPLAQPRAFLVGTTIASIIGQGIEKLFMTRWDNADHLWLSGGLSVAVSSVIMDLTGTTHPPAGAAALLPSLDESIRGLGWKYIVLVLVSCCVFLSCALVFDNILLRYPTFWWVDKPIRIRPQENLKNQIIITPDGFESPDGLELDELQQEMIRTIQLTLEAHLEVEK